MSINFYDKKSHTHFKKNTDRLVAENTREVPIINYIPRFVSADGYSSAFGLQWKTFSCLQLDSYTGTEISKKRILEALSHSLEWLHDKTVLEAGSGGGRFTEWLKKYCKELYTFDLSRAIEVNYQWNKADNVVFFQADILDIPLPDKSFDVVFCLGVIQHTPDSKKAIQELWRTVKPGGILVADHYHFRWAYYTTSIPVYRFFLKRMNPERSLKIIEKLVTIFFPLHWRLRHSKVGRWLLGHFSPILTNIDTFEQKGYAFNKQTSVLESYDALTDYYKRLIKKSELIKILSSLPDLASFDIKRGSNGWVFKVVKSHG
ncbi:class I SAM-dependent methyltransferase [Schleiferia thermophila]|jgi:2-polyprenyl-3-methyl-5-hydroxy-6-metoxy-1,4-benzoquinol methylase|uniref:Methyltransferase family protein n=1 Tax=Schleiferia thermophila TaxID=884107 RepID=A0A369A3S1_9FLAO|nr:class I SAM-dependent methyltransferase [Schleiferia thermophila]KFD39649.1 2-polyprenyl-3-methyl-5-hydroxy-6-metoxy-1,4-benzoquinol methylase [Schleiferia thermophila str. Yellowstone]RCX03811.1 methyltransferase family protein [Schleiferia thermophila]